MSCMLLRLSYGSLVKSSLLFDIRFGLYSSLGLDSVLVWLLDGDVGDNSSAYAK